MSIYKECWLFKTAFCFLLLWESIERVNNSQKKQYWELKNNYFVPHLVKNMSIEMSINIVQVSIPSSKEINMQGLVLADASVESYGNVLKRQKLAPDNSCAWIKGRAKPWET